MASTHSQRWTEGMRAWGQKADRWAAGVDPATWPGRALTWGPVLVLMALIFWLSSMSEPFGPDPTWMDDWIGVAGHFGEYALLALAWRWALVRQWPELSRPGWIALGLSLLYALSDEYHQSFVPGRVPDPWDILTDLAGAFAALWLRRRWVRWLIG